MVHLNDLKIHPHPGVRLMLVGPCPGYHAHARATVPITLSGLLGLPLAGLPGCVSAATCPVPH
jgi:hypothetical protein